MAALAQRGRRDRPTLLRARLALPLGAPPIADAALVIHRTRLVTVGAWSSARRHHAGPVLDLGERLLLPGLLNTHCHLDYTHMAGLFPPPSQFVDWIKSITVTKQTWSDEEFRASWLAGAAMLLRHGTTTVADVEAIPALLPAVWQQTPLRVISFLEMTGIRSRRNPEVILAEALRTIAQLRRGRCRAMLSPHAPYSTKPELLRQTAQVSRKRRWLMTTHVAESTDEQEMFMRRRGDMFDWLQRNERDMSDCGGVSPVQHMARANALHRRLLAIHVNHLEAGDAECLARQGATVVHCPRSHAYFRHHPFPFDSLKRAGVNICLATDSLASVRQTRQQPVELNLFAEMREFASHHPQVDPLEILHMVTLHAARALGLAGRAGQLTPGACADVIAIPFGGARSEAAHAAVTHPGPVDATMIAGRWGLPPNEHAGQLAS